MVENNSCYNCKERTINCHGSCEKYKEFIKKKEEYKAKVKKAKETQYWAYKKI